MGHTRQMGLGLAVLLLSMTVASALFGKQGSTALAMKAQQQATLPPFPTLKPTAGDTATSAPISTNTPTSTPTTGGVVATATAISTATSVPTTAPVSQSTATPTLPPVATATATALPTATSAPAAKAATARIVANALMRREGSYVVVTWRVVYRLAIKGFQVYAGKTPLTRAIVTPHRSPLYAARVLWVPKVKYTLHVLYANGRTLVVQLKAH